MAKRNVAKANPAARVSQEHIERAIYLIRGEKVMLDEDLARLYGVETWNLTRAVGRNRGRFPDDFMFRLTSQEFADLKRQNGGSSAWGGRRRSAPSAFTQEGVAMLSSVLRSKLAVEVNIQIMRAFVRLRELMLTHKDLAAKLRELERKYDGHEKHFAVVFEAIRKLLEPGTPAPKPRIGFRR